MNPNAPPPQLVINPVFWPTARILKKHCGTSSISSAIASALLSAIVLRRYIPKADGRQRPLGIPTVRDRVAQMAATIVLEPKPNAERFAATDTERRRRLVIRKK